MGVNRIYVEKRKGCDVEAAALKADIRQTLGLPARGVRILHRYDVQGLDGAELAEAVKNVFSEAPVDTVFAEEVGIPKGWKAFAVEYLPGQYDQRADSAAQCIQLLTRGERPLVRYAKLYLVQGLSQEQLDALKRYVINPVDSCEATLDKYGTLEVSVEVPGSVATVDGFTAMEKGALRAFTKRGGFAMTVDDMLCAQEYFKSEQRDPTITELRILDTYWSDHCRHTTFLTSLDKVEFAADPVSRVAEGVYGEYLEARERLGVKKDPCLMDLATIYARDAKKAGRLPNLDVSAEVNACTIKHTIETDKGPQDYLILFKNETHNHPTEIEPFGGAATCLGGAIRDPLSGRAYVYQAMRVTGSGDPRESLEDTMEHKLPQRKITKEAAHGYSSYGNQIGLATGLVSEVYHPGYKAKRMEIGAVIGAVPAKNVVREAPEKGDLVLLIGGRTGRDGIGGATGSSKSHDEKSVEKSGAEVQKGNPLTERKLQRLFRNGEFSGLVKRCNDFGAGGVSVAIGELADGLDINLDAVPKKYEGLDGTELAISESQERMAVVIDADDLNRVLELAAEENLEASVVAEVTDDARMRMTWNGQVIVDISREFLDSNGAAQHAGAKVKQFAKNGFFDEPTEDTAGETLWNLLNDLNLCSQKGLTEMFDSTIGAGTVAMPLGGKYQLTPIQTMSALVPTLDGRSDTATLMSWGLDPYLMEKSPFLGALYAVVDSAAKVAAAGGDIKDAWLTLQEYFEKPGKDPKRWGKPLGALLGAYMAQCGLKIAAIGGKDSMSGSFGDLDVPPTLCSFCLAPVPAENVITPEFKQAGNKLYLLEIKRDKNGIPDFEDIRRKYEKLHGLIADKTVVSAYAIGRGGILAGVAKNALGNGLGVKLDEGDVRRLARKEYGSILVESADIEDSDFEEIGELRREQSIKIVQEKLPLSDVAGAFMAPLEGVFPTLTKERGKIPVPPVKKKSVVICKYKTALPRVAIPVFPGTNCEYDTAAAFERAGAVPQVVVMRNLTATDIEESARELEGVIRNAQIIMIPGGFSAGDEPDGSGKFIATTFRSKRIMDATMELLQRRDGLMLGICNGFQALIKLGLVPYGEIIELNEFSPTLTYNVIGRHVSCMVRTRVASTNSPWLSMAQVGDVHTVAVSHGEGRFVGSEEEVTELAKSGQIATQYVDFKGMPSMGVEHNPNGSMYAIEGLLSPDGRVLGKMGHSERAGRHVAKNVPGDYDQKIFESGVRYFK